MSAQDDAPRIIARSAGMGMRAAWAIGGNVFLGSASPAIGADGIPMGLRWESTREHWERYWDSVLSLHWERVEDEDDTPTGHYPCAKCGDDDAVPTDGQWCDDCEPPWDEIVAEFEEFVLPYVIEQYGRDDEIAQREAFNDWTDSLCKDGRISERQYNDEPNPY